MAACSSREIDLHNEMINKLSKDIAPERNMEREWRELLGLFENNPLPKVTIQTINNIQDLCRALMDQKTIDYGRYDVLIQNLERIGNRRLADVVRNYEGRILKQIEENFTEEEYEQRGSDSGRKSQKRKRSEEERERSAKRKLLTEEERKRLHADMLDELNECISVDQTVAWATFTARLKTCLGKAVIARMKNIYDVVDELMAKGKVSYGNYEELIKLVRPVDKDLVDIIEKYSNRFTQRQ